MAYTQITIHSEKEIYNIETGGVCSIVKVPCNTKMSEFLADKTYENHVEDSTWYSVGTVEACEIYDVFLKPKNGAFIQTIQCCQSWENTKSNLSTGYEPSTTTGSPTTTATNGSFDIAFKNRETLETDYTNAGSGLIYLGRHRVVKYTDTTYHPDAEQEETTTSSYESITTYQYTVIGKLDQFTCTLHGDTDDTNLITYAYRKKDTDSDSEPYRVLVFRTSKEKQIYTNVIAFNEPYSGGSTLPSKFLYCGATWRETSKYLADGVTIPTGNTLGFLADPSITTHFHNTYDGDSLDDSVRSIHIYIDCFISVITPSWEYGTVTVTESTEKKLSEETKPKFTKYTVKYLTPITQKEKQSISEYDPQFDWYKTVYSNDVDLRPSNQSNPSIVGNYSLYINNKNKGDDYSEWDFSNNISDEIGWVRLLNLYHGEKITEYNCICRLVNKNGTYDVSINSYYLRYTGYVFVYTSIFTIPSVGTNSFIAKQGYFPKNFCWNCQIYPIVKPWAAVHLSDFAPAVAAEAFGQVRDNNWTYRYVKDILNKRYDSKYVKEIDIQGKSSAESTSEQGDSSETIRKKINRYVRTISPIRVETWLVHGGRVEYDDTLYVNNASNGSNWKIGCSYLCAGSSVNISPKGFRNIHDNVYKYSTISSLPLQWNIFSESCFSQGIVYDGPIQHTESRNKLTLSGAKAGVVHYDDIFASYGACASYTDCGLPDGSGTGSLILSKCLQDNCTYDSLVTNGNSLVQRLKNVVYELISNFYYNYYDRIHRVLDDTNAQILDETREYIEDDLDNNEGRKYFTAMAWKKPPQTDKQGNTITNDTFVNQSETFSPSLNRFASSNCFPGTSYEINSGVIGMIKHYVFDEDVVSIDDYNIAVCQSNNHNLIEKKTLNLTIYDDLDEDVQYAVDLIRELGKDSPNLKDKLKEKIKESYPNADDDMIELNAGITLDEANEYLNQGMTDDEVNEQLEQVRQHNEYCDDILQGLVALRDSVKYRANMVFNTDEITSMMIPLIEPVLVVSDGMKDTKILDYTETNSSLKKCLTSDEDLDTLCTDTQNIVISNLESIYSESE